MASSITNKPAAENPRGAHFSPLGDVAAINVPPQFGTSLGSHRSRWSKNIWANSADPPFFSDRADQSRHPDAAQRSLASVENVPLLPTTSSKGWNGGSASRWVNALTPNTSLPSSSSNNESSARPPNTRSPHITVKTNKSLHELSSAAQSASDVTASLDAGPPDMNTDTSGHSSFSKNYSCLEKQDRSLDDRSFLPSSNVSSNTMSSSESSLPVGFSAMSVQPPIKDPVSTHSRVPKPGQWFGYTHPCLEPEAQPSAPIFAPESAFRPNHLPFHLGNTASDVPLHRAAGQTLPQHSLLNKDAVNLSLRGVDPFSSNTISGQRPSDFYTSFEPQHNGYAGPMASNDACPSGSSSENTKAGQEQNREDVAISQRSSSLSKSDKSSPYTYRTSHCSRMSPHRDHPPVSSTAGSGRSVSLSSSSVSGATSPLSALEGRFHGWQPFQADPQGSQTSCPQLGSAYPQPSVGTSFQTPLSMNPLARSYAMPTNYSAFSVLARNATQSAHERRGGYPESTQAVRSQMLEEFRTNSRSSKRCELRDVFHHIVEFSGDQYGSRFIQLKLETANSDEKEQVFDEILPNAVQLMTDIFGNYVIQKLFEHGSQTQKKILANQMKGHVLTLSTQTYGCRVVQKALEHVLLDQQVSLVSELENSVLKCVNDQNGNHVIQKVVERLPDKYIQFIIRAFHQQIQRLATHAYGCRVVQRMLEHCEPTTRQSILNELHDCVSSLIVDQFGNYVIQHIITNGMEEDRRKIIAVVISQLFAFSKHKFASNVVEKSIDHGEVRQRTEILSLLTTPNCQQGNPALALVGDSYGNYVIQKVLSHLVGVERESLVEQIRAHMAYLKRNNNPKQVAAIEKLISTVDVESNPNASSQSSSLPSTNASTVEGPVISRGTTTKCGFNQVGSSVPTENSIPAS